MKITTLEEFIEHRVQPAHRGIVEMLRKLMREDVPESREVITYGILAWKIHKMIAVVSPTKKDITFAFSRGAEFKDKYKLLQGVGKVSKHVKISDVAAIDKEALRYYIAQAVAFDKKAQ